MEFFRCLLYANSPGWISFPNFPSSISVNSWQYGSSIPIMRAWVSWKWMQICRSNKILRQIARHYKGRRFYNKIHGQRSNYQEDYGNWWEVEYHIRKQSCCLALKLFQRYYHQERYKSKYDTIPIIKYIYYNSIILNYNYVRNKNHQKASK